MHAAQWRGCVCKVQESKQQLIASCSETRQVLTQVQMHARLLCVATPASSPHLCLPVACLPPSSLKVAPLILCILIPLSLSLQVSGALSSLASELTCSVDQVNELAAASLGDASTPMGSVVRVLNGQLQALGQLEGRVEELNGQLAALKVAAPGLGAGSGFGGMIRAARGCC